MANYFNTPTVNGLTENQLSSLSIEYSNLKDQIMSEYKEAQAVIDDAIEIHQEERKKNSDPGDIQGVG